MQRFLTQRLSPRRLSVPVEHQPIERRIGQSSLHALDEDVRFLAMVANLLGLAVGARALRLPIGALWGRW